MKKIPENYLEHGLENVALGDIITCPSDRTKGATWQVESIDAKGNIHAKLINQESSSDFYSKLGDEKIIPPQAWEKWERI